MKRLSRVLGLAAVVLLTSLATAKAQGPVVGICYFVCLDGDHSASSTLQDCCSGWTPVCAGGETPAGISWRVRGGAEQTCEP